LTRDVYFPKRLINFFILLFFFNILSISRFHFESSIESFTITSVIVIFFSMSLP